MTKRKTAKPKVWSRRKGAPKPPPGAIYVGRPSKWGNPFVTYSEADRPAMIRAFRIHMEDTLAECPDWLKPLRGKHLVCWCAPKPCHADVLLELANKEEPKP